jgi:hypoxanthine phosphoribosyltransferase
VGDRAPGPPVVLIAEAEIARRVDELARQVSADYAAAGELVLVGVLRGAFIFLADLSRRLTIPCRVDFIALSSYERGARPGAVRLVMDLRVNVTGKHVLVVEDIVDTGLTMRYLLQTLAGRGPNSLGICCLLDRTSRRLVQVPVEYRCFEIGDHFVVGFGLDHKQLFRNLPYLAVMKQESPPPARSQKPEAKS